MKLKSHYFKCEGFVKEVHPPESGVFTMEDHGCFELEISKIGTLKYLKPGEIEHFVLWRWEDEFEVI